MDSCLSGLRHLEVAAVWMLLALMIGYEVSHGVVALWGVSLAAGDRVGDRDDSTGGGTGRHLYLESW
jgi:hypothetical protein